MREVISVHCGNCGVNTGASFWELIVKEHLIDTSGVMAAAADQPLLAYPNVYFKEVAKGRHIPRAVLVDLDPGSIDNIRSGNMSKIFSPEAFVNGKCSTGNNWAKGYYGSGAILIDQIMDQIHKLAEECDLLQGFQYTRSISGGTGSGLGSLILETLGEEYPALIHADFPVFPAANTIDACLGPYNAVLGMNISVEKTHLSYTFDNEALTRVCNQSLKKPAPVFSDLNELMSQVMSNATCGLRFPGQLNTGLRKIATALVPFP